ncbi:type I-B CRISPR-associated protein Cas7/Csh2 [Candidatus Uabimicrobium sp. HlEnr_7]|uniref:type I-B CRISPR-associated protein Cas7/Csh2 n=1 Tax=Candidatus Uabimicrobium helgolandensis TaxID=3095367 RepID=UPI00355650B9
MSNTIKNRYEILFLYDIKDGNPNGDPNDENKPRIDEETSQNLVTDVRLKRTIRDYLHQQGNDIFVQEKTHGTEGHIQDAKLRANDYAQDLDLSKVSIGEAQGAIAKNILSSCIDVRLFGATIPLEIKLKSKSQKGSITYTGPVQFKMGRSLHKVKINFIKGTGAFASKQNSTQKTFREEYMLPYSLIAFHGIINENAAKHTLLSDNDVLSLKKALWSGTKELISRSKFGQMPRLLLLIKYKKANFFMGDLDHLIKLKSELRDEELRSPVQYKIDLSLLLNKIEKNKEHIEAVEFAHCDQMSFCDAEKDLELAQIDKFKNIDVV